MSLCKGICLALLYVWALERCIRFSALSAKERSLSLF